MAHSAENNLANPANIIQAYGRNRGLNRFKTPNFLLVAQNQVNCLFGVEELNKADYQRDYDKSIINFKRYYIKKLGLELGNEILNWIEENKDAFHEVDDEKLSEAVIEKCFAMLEKVNQVNAFRFKLTQKDYTQVLNVAIGNLRQKQRDLKKGTTLPSLVNILGICMHALAKMMRWIAARKPKSELKKIIKSLGSDNQEDSKLAKIHYRITTIPTKDIWQHSLSLQLVFMNIATEAKSILTTRDKYYSAIFLKPLNILSTEHKNIIKSDYPQLKILLEGIASYIALSTLEDKDKLLGKAVTAVKNQDDTAIEEIFDELKKLQINKEHPQNDVHLPRIEQMLTTLGYGDGESVDQIKNDVLLPPRIMLCVSNNEEGLQYLTPNNEQAFDYLKHIKLLIIKDIKKLVYPFISDPAFIEMLDFIQNNFTAAELKTIFTENQDIVKRLKEFTEDVKSNSNKEDFYEKYCFPPLEKLEGEPEEIFKLENLEIVKIREHLDKFFEALHESNSMFYKISAQGEVKTLEPEENLLFRARDTNNLAIKKAFVGYDVRVNEKPSSEKPTAQIVYLQAIDGKVTQITQVNAQGVTMELEVEPDKLSSLNLADMLIKDKDGKSIDINEYNGTIRAQLKNSGLVRLNEIIVSSSVKDNKKQRSESILSPALSDENTENGKVWRQIFGLNSLKTALPTINRMNYKMRRKETEKAVEVSSKLLENIKKRREIISADKLITHASLFSKVLKEESKALKKPGNPNADESALGNKTSRVEKLKAKFEEEKKAYKEFDISGPLKKKIEERVNSYLKSRSRKDKNSKENNIIPRPFFNRDLTTKKVELANKFMRKFKSDKIANNYESILDLVEKTINENRELMKKHGKNPLAKNDLDKALTMIKEYLVEYRKDKTNSNSKDLRPTHQLNLSGNYCPS